MSTDQNQPADSPGLDAAIEAAAREMYQLKVIWGDGRWEDTTERNRAAYRREAQAVIRAAAPALRAGALREAAEHFDQLASIHSNPVRIANNEHAATWLRERADRIGGAT